MADSIFLRRGSEIVAMKNQPYDSEDLLQKLIALHPDLLAGDQIDSAAPRRWLLVQREAGIPGDVGASDRWTVDHLFLDQDGVPTLVAMKRSSDTRIRREVVGQMLDYAANAATYWSADEVRRRFEERCRSENATPEDRLSDFLGEGVNIDAWWDRVKTNLKAGKLRMIFAADEIPQELKRIVEFMNGQMDPAEVLAVEIKQFIGEGVETFVPRIYGQTSEAQQQKGRTSRPPPAPSPLLLETIAKFNLLGSPIAPVSPPNVKHAQIVLGPTVHYEWWIREDAVHCAIHFEDPSAARNKSLVSEVEKRRDEIEAGSKYRLKFGNPIVRKWQSAHFEVPIAGKSKEQLSTECAHSMKHLIDKTYELLVSLDVKS